MHAKRNKQIRYKIKYQIISKFMKIGDTDTSRGREDHNSHLDMFKTHHNIPLRLVIILVTDIYGSK